MIVLFLICKILADSPLDALLVKQPIDKDIVLEITTTTKTIVKEVNSTVGIQIDEYKDVTKESSGANMPSAVQIKTPQKCYVMSINGEISEALEAANSLGLTNYKAFTKHNKSVAFCAQNDEQAKEFSRKVNGHHLQEDSVYQVSSVQYPISNHLFIMKNYTNNIFNSTFYNNIFFRILQINKLFRYMLGTYKYHYTGKGVRIYSIDTTVQVKSPFVRNISGKTRSCTSHGDVTIDLINNNKNGFAKDAEIIVLDGVECDGKIKLSGILAQLEHIQSTANGTICLIGVSGPYSDLLNRAVDTLSAKGTIVITPAGNNSDNACFYSPASAKSAIAVGSVNMHTNISRFSNYGGCVRLYALGENIYETNDTYGSSRSAAIVAGAVSIFLQKYPKATFLAVWDYLHNNAYWNNNYLVLKMPYLTDTYNNKTKIQYEDAYFDMFLHFVMGVIIFLLLVYIIINMRSSKKRHSSDEIVINRNKRNK